MMKKKMEAVMMVHRFMIGYMILLFPFLKDWLKPWKLMMNLI